MKNILYSCVQGPLIQWAQWTWAQGPELEGTPGDKYVFFTVAS